MSTTAPKDILDNQVIRVKKGRLNSFGFEPAWNSYFDFYLGSKYLAKPLLKLEDVSFHLFLRKNLNADDPNWHMPSIPMMKKRLGVSQDKIEGMINRLIKAHLLKKVSGKKKGTKGANVTNDYVLSDPISDTAEFLQVAAQGLFPYVLKPEWQQRGTSTEADPLPEIGKAPLYRKSVKAPLPEIGKHKHTSVIKQTQPLKLSPLTKSTEEKPLSKSKELLVVELKKRGVHGKTAQHLVNHYSRQRIEDNIDYADQKNKLGEVKTNLAGFLIKAINQNFIQDNTDKRIKTRRQKAEADSRRRQKNQETLKQRKDIEFRSEASHEKQETKYEKKVFRYRADYKTTPREYEHVWPAVVSAVAGEKPSIQAHLAKSELLQVSDERAVIGVNSAFSQECCQQKKYTHLIEPELAKHYAAARFKLEFIVMN